MTLQTIDEFAASLDRVGTTMNGVQDAALHKCIPVLRAKIADNIANGATADGYIWKPHAPATIARYGPHPLLVLTGSMKEATLEEGREYHIETIEDGMLTFGISGDHPSHPMSHQQGTDTIPQREFVAIDEQTFEEITQIIADEMTGVLE